MSRAEAIFENRSDAGQQLAAKLGDYAGRPVVVLAIPNGGVPVALEVAGALGKVDLDLVISRKIPVPLNPEAGMGAVADDGTVILNEDVVRKMGLSRQQIEYEASQVRAEIKRRSMLYHGDRPLAAVSGKTVLVVDDGLASGFTMMAAVESIRHRRPREVIVAVPVAAALAVKQLERIADGMVTCVTSYAPRFYIAEFYRQWYDLSDDEVIRLVRQWRSRRLR